MKAKVKISDIETPLQGQLNGAIEKKKIWGNQVKVIREKLKNEPLNANRMMLRLKLIEVRIKHQEAIANEKTTRELIEKRANELGATTINQN